jgi:hypothetical protein
MQHQIVTGARWFSFFGTYLHEKHYTAQFDTYDFCCCLKNTVCIVTFIYLEFF